MKPYRPNRLGIAAVRAALALIVATVAPATVRAQEREKVVFVHGLNQDGNAWYWLAGDLAARHPVTPLKPTLGSFSHYADQASVLSSYLTSEQVNNIAALSHSNGGVVVREYARLTPSPRVNRHLSLGTPHRGAELAWNVGSGNLLWWAGDIGYRILDPVWTYRGADPDWQWLWFDYGSALYLESAAWLIWEGLTEVLPAGLEILGLPTSWFPYVLEDMPPFSETFYYLNHSSTLAQEAQRIPIARVSISTQYMPELAPWRAAAAATGGGSFDALYLWYVQQDLINLAWDAYYYYWFHPNWELSSNAYKWQDMAWALMTIQADWQVFIGSTWGHNDGIVPWSSSDYPGGSVAPRRVTLTDGPVWHGDQLAPVSNPDADAFRVAISDAVSQHLNISYPPPPPTCTVTSMSGPYSAWPYEWVTVGVNTAGCATPVTYSWTIDGYPTCGNENTCGGWVGAEGTYTTFAVTVTPAQGAPAYGSLSVWVPYGGCEFGCPEKVQVPGGMVAPSGSTPVKTRVPFLPRQKPGPVHR